MVADSEEGSDDSGDEEGEDDSDSGELKDMEEDDD